MISAKHQHFAEEYSVDLCAKAAAERVGYSVKHSHIQGRKMLRRPDVAAEVKRLLAKRARKSKGNRDRILLELEHIAFSDIEDFYEFDHNGARLRNSVQMGEELTRAVAEVKQTANGARVRLHDKLKALDMLARMHGEYKDTPSTERGTDNLPPHVNIYMPDNTRGPTVVTSGGKVKTEA